MYIIKKNNTDSTIVYMEYDNNAYEIDNLKDIHVESLKIYDKKYLSKKDDIKNNKEQIPFGELFENLTRVVFNYLYNDDDTDEGVTGLLIDEVDRLKNELDSDYKEFMKREEYYDYVNKIGFLRRELLNRQAINKYQEELNQLTSKSR